MALNSIHLYKLLKIMFLPDRARKSALREDIRTEISKETGRAGGGGDFYAPFWFDAKLHVFGVADLHDSVEQRIASNPRRRNLFPHLRDGFLLWWNKRRRWTNEPFQPGQGLKARFPVPGLGAVVKIDSVLSVRDAGGVERFVYPYFAPDVPLSDEAARLGLWVLGCALSTVPAIEIRILDVLRGATFSLDRNPFDGGEGERFRRAYAAILKEREELEKEYR